MSQVMLRDACALLSPAAMPITATRPEAALASAAITSAPAPLTAEMGKVSDPSSTRVSTRMGVPAAAPAGLSHIILDGKVEAH
eukprot:9099587-Pyramimonas_sp.AAC.1